MILPKIASARHIVIGLLCITLAGCATAPHQQRSKAENDGPSISYLAYAEASECVRLNDFLPAEEAAKRAVNAEPPGTHHLLQELGMILIQRGKYGEAISTFRDAQKVWTTRSTDPAHYPPRNLANALSEYGDYTLADSTFPNPMDGEWGLDYLLAHKIRMENWQAASEICLERIQRYQREGLMRSDYMGPRLIDLAHLLNLLGRHAEALPCAEEARELQEHGIAQPPVIADSFMMLAQTQFALGRTTESAENLLTVIRLFKKPGLRDRVSQACVILARQSLKQGALSESDEYFRQAHQLYCDMGRDGHPDAADALKGLADVALKRDQLSSATVLCERALAVFDGSILPDHPRITPTLVALAALDTLTSQPTTRIEERFARIEACRKKPLGQWHEDVEDTLTLYTPLLRAQGHTATAERLERYLPPPPKLTFTIPDGLTAEVGPSPQFIERSRQ